MECEDCLNPKQWWERLATSESYLLKTCCVCGRSEVVEDEVRFCACGGEFTGWKPRESKCLNNKHLKRKGE